jgi:hypothetical protein
LRLHSQETEVDMKSGRWAVGFVAVAAALAISPPVAAAPVPATSPCGGAEAAAASEAENRRLRLLLQLEREENARLEAKLRAAARLADLVLRRTEAVEQPKPRAESPWKGSD